MTSSSVPLCRQYIITRSFCKVLQVDLGGAFAPAGDAPSPGQSLIPEGSFMSYNVQITQLDELIRGHNGAWGGISAEAVARMRLQNRFKTGLDIARCTRSEAHTSELQSLMRISYAVFCLKKKK